jgi:NhaA family Na+:H+ antiporter
MNTTRSGLARFVLDNSLLLLAGTGAAVVWANLDFRSYDRVAHPLHFVVNDIGMVFFFALAAKEVFEATLPGGAVASPRRALSPVSLFLATAAFPAGTALAETKMVALLSFVAAPIAVVVSRMLRVRANWQPASGAAYRRTR